MNANKLFTSRRDRLYDSLLRRFRLREAYELRVRGYLKERGWFDSFGSEPPRDGFGNPVPWINYSAIDFLEKRISPDLRVFEYGCGHSTLWWAIRVREIVSVEHDEKWAQIMRPQLPSNARLLTVPLNDDGSAYTRSIERAGDPFDLIVVDGRRRVECARVAIDHLTQFGVVLLDDAERERYQPALDEAAKRGFKTLPLSGMKPKSYEASTLAIIYRSGENVLNL